MEIYAGQVDGAPGSISVLRDALDVGGRRLPYVEMDAVAIEGHRIELGMHPSGSTRLSGLGPRTDAFVADLVAARSAARRAALLHWTGTPEIAHFRQAVAGPGQLPVEIHVFSDGFTVEPPVGTAELVPYALVDRIAKDGYTTTFHLRGIASVTVRRLGPRTDEFHLVIERCRAEQRAALADAYGALDDRLRGFAAPDGWAVTADDAGVFGGALAEAFRGGERSVEMTTLAELATGGMRYGITIAPGGAMPFVLAVGAHATAVEAAGDESARATYVFATTDADALNRALILTSFRREALYLPENRLGRWSLAARTLPAVRWARSVFAARIVHDENWPAAILSALG